MSARGDERLRVRMLPAIKVVSAGLITNLTDDDSDSVSKQDYHLTKRSSTCEAVTTPAANNTAWDADRDVPCGRVAVHGPRQ